MKANPVAQVYANALLAIGQEQGNFAQIIEELGVLIDLMRDQPEFRVFLEAPIIPSERKVAAADAIMGTDFCETVRNFIAVVIEKGRASLVREIHATLLSIADDEADRLRAEVASAVELSPEKLAEIKKLITTKSGKREVVLAATVDPSLLGGFVIQYGDTRIDGSIANRLQEVRHRLQSQGGLS